MTIIMYGIKACSTVKKARDWLDARNIAYDFHDYKLAGADPARLRAWCEEFGWDVVLNRAGTTFRKLSEGDKENLGIEKAITLMQAQPSMIKRPIIDTGTRRLVGFKPELYHAALTE